LDLKDTRGVNALVTLDPVLVRHKRDHLQGYYPLSSIPGGMIAVVTPFSQEEGLERAIYMLSCAEDVLEYAHASISPRSVELDIVLGAAWECADLVRVPQRQEVTRKRDEASLIPDRPEVAEGSASRRPTPRPSILAVVCRECVPSTHDEGAEVL